MSKGEDEQSEDLILAPLPSETVVPDEYKSLTLFDEMEVDSARVGSRIFISIKSICVFLGIQTQGQTVKIRSKPILAGGIKIIKLPSRGGPQDTLCLDFDVFPLWLLDIHPKKTKPEFQQTIFETQIQISKVVRDVYYAYVLAQMNPDYAYIIRLLEQVLAEVRSVVDNSGEMGHVITMLLQMIGGQRQTGGQQGQISGAKPVLRLISGGQVVETDPSEQEGNVILRDRFQTTGDTMVVFDDERHRVLLVSEESQQIPLTPDQTLQLLARLTERRGWLLQEYYEDTK
jgi:hypothetical protein